MNPPGAHVLAHQPLGGRRRAAARRRLGPDRAHARRRPRRLSARRGALVAFHEQTALASLIAIALHGVALLPDKFLKPGLDGMLVPFAIDYRPAYVAAGIVGGYLAALLGLSFYARRRIGGKRWRNLHRATPIVYVLGLVHTLGAGTDAGSSWLRAFMLATAVPAAALLVKRLTTKKQRRPAPTPKGATA